MFTGKEDCAVAGTRRAEEGPDPHSTVAGPPESCTQPEPKPLADFSHFCVTSPVQICS
jgi:hypothetical protein